MMPAAPAVPAGAAGAGAPEAAYLTARTVEEAVAAMAAGARPIAGGTDLVVGARHGKAPLPPSLVGIHRLTELARVEGPTADGLRLGALVTHAVIAGHPAVLAFCTGLADASAIVGSYATRANGTLGGNVMNASPAMDTGAPLICHDAVAVLHGLREVRRLPLAQLWTAPGTVSCAPGELLLAIEIPPLAARPGETAGSAYVRLQYRRQMEIAIVGAAAAVRLSPDGRMHDVRIAITAVAPTIRRVPAAEAVLDGVGPVTGPALQAEALPVPVQEAVREASRQASAAAEPISDVRGSAAYRRAMTGVVVRRAITAAVLRASGTPVAVPASDSTFGS